MIIEEEKKAWIREQLRKNTKQGDSENKRGRETEVLIIEKHQCMQIDKDENINKPERDSEDKGRW